MRSFQDIYNWGFGRPEGRRLTMYRYWCDKHTKFHKNMIESEAYKPEGYLNLLESCKNIPMGSLDEVYVRRAHLDEIKLFFRCRKYIRWGRGDNAVYALKNLKISRLKYDSRNNK